MCPPARPPAKVRIRHPSSGRDNETQRDRKSRAGRHDDGARLSVVSRKNLNTRFSSTDTQTPKWPHLTVLCSRIRRYAGPGDRVRSALKRIQLACRRAPDCRPKAFARVSLRSFTEPSEHGDHGLPAGGCQHYKPTANFTEAANALLVLINAPCPNWQVSRIGEVRTESN